LIGFIGKILGGLSPKLAMVDHAVDRIANVVQ